MLENNESGNQVDALANVNLYDTDPVLQGVLQHLGAQSGSDALRRHGEYVGAASNRCLAQQANRHPPEHTPWDALGRRVDHITFHPAWHKLMASGFEYGLHKGKGGCAESSHQQLLRGAHFMLHGQLEAGSLCPLTMTHAAHALLYDDPRFASFVERMQSTHYDARDIPWWQKTGVMVGMGLTEKQGGTDLRQCRTQATPVASPDTPILDAIDSQHFRLLGHKWFFSSPTSDAHLVLAREQPEGELSCFFVPRWLACGHRNGIRVNRLKDKLGNHSNASAEIEFDQALAIRVGEAGRGIGLLMTMAGLTRMDCVLGSTALLRQALVQALHYARHRQVMGRALIDQPLMRGVLADLALESEACTTLALHLAHTFDCFDEQALAWQRILTPAAKYWVCQRATAAIAECMECLGGNGYIEDGPLARLYREAPVNAIWEGSGNVMCLDVMRGLSRQPQLAQVLWSSLEPACQDHPVLEASLRRLSELVHADMDQQQARARWFVRQLIELVQAVLLRQSSPAEVLEVFVQTRLVAPAVSFGDAPQQVEQASLLLQRAWPSL